ncbi:MAG: hypothetical protein K0Q49_1015 [Haloplasmataceae bacterium]|jgi:hypothetical protein|nr:hypothetical protein [Haloplasmataceae bacterium]
MASNRESQRNVLYNTEKYQAQNDYVKDLIDREKNIVNEDKYNVELGKDFTINAIPENLVEQHKDITGYTAGLITRDLVTMGEQMISNNKKENKK